MMTTIPLTPIDHIFTGVGSYPIEFVFAYGDRIDPNRLQSSLREVVRLFVPVRSRLVEVLGNTYALLPSDDGMQFHHYGIGDSDARLSQHDTCLRILQR